MLKNAIKHFFLILRHKRMVFRHCAKCGLIWQGLIHDLSKFSATEFFESVKYFKGYRSPIGVCRREKGVSLAWLHHKGRNKHHIEYWLDDDCETPPLMPYRYAVECVCDKIAATKIYNGRSYTPDMAMAHWVRYGSKVKGNPRTMKFVETVFSDLAEYGEKYVLNKKYMRATYDKIANEK